MFQKIFTIVVFLCVYGFLASAKKRRTRAVWLGALVLMLGGVYCREAPSGFLDAARMSIGTVFEAVNWTVIGIFAGMMLLAEMFTSSKVPLWLSDVTVERSHSVGWALVLVCALASLISAFVENVATVLIVAPLVFELSKRLKISPIAPIVGIAISSNLQGMATLTGDPPSMLMAMHFDPAMTFNDFFWYRGKMGMFFVVQVGAFCSLAALYFGFFRKLTREPGPVERVRVTTWAPTIALVGLIATLAVMSLGRHEAQYPGLVCVVFGIGTLLATFFRSRKDAVDALKSYDWRTIMLLMGIFVVVRSVHLVGLTSDIAGCIKTWTGGSLLGSYVLIIVVSVILSGFIANIPYITLMLPVTGQLSAELGLDPNAPLLPYGLLIGACLGGNLSPLGAEANIVGVELLRRRGHHTSFWDFAKMGIPFTAAATVPAAVVVWFLWR